MNAFVRKEARMLLPNFSAAFLMALGLWLQPAHFNPTSELSTLFRVVPFVLCPAMAVMLALDSFGREFGAGTFSSLLAQPIPRSRVWWTKTALLAAALSVLAAVWLLSFAIHFREKLASPELQEMYSVMARIVVLTALVIFSGGLWTTLLFRQTGVAFWFTILTPGLLIAAIIYKFDNHAEEPQPALRFALTLACVLYSVAGFLLAWWLFRRAQDRQWTGGVIALPEFGAVSRWFGRRRTHRRLRPRAALFRKEWRLHQSQIALAGGLLLLHLGALAMRRYVGKFHDSPALEFILQNFWVLWMLMPWLVGCTAVAEERKLGTLEAHLCLPVRRRTQFVIKFISTMLIAVLLGAVVPVLLEGKKILPDFDLHFGESAASYPDGYYSQFGHSLGVFLSVALPFLTLVAIALSTAAISFYASSFTRNTLQAIAPSMLGILGAYIWWFGAPQFTTSLWRGWIVHCVGVPVMVPALVGLMYWNFKRVPVGWPVWRRNLIVLGGAFVFVILATASIYHRAWEVFLTMEPPHGSARFTLSNAPVLRPDSAGAVAQLPDGRVWMRHYDTAPTLLMPAARSSGGLIEGTNWANVTRVGYSFVGVQRYGSLWLWKSSAPDARAKPSPPPQWQRIGTDNDWKSVATTWPWNAFLLKTDGTLWRLGTNAPSQRAPRIAALDSNAPERLGADSDWKEVSVSANGQVHFRKADGRVWVYPPSIQPFEDGLELAPGFSIQPADYMTDYRTATAVIASGRYVSVGIHNDGSLRVNAHRGPLPKREGQRQLNDFIPDNIPLGTDTNWVAVAGIAAVLVALKSDGTLWRWRFPDYPRREVESATATRIGTQSDWVAVSSALSGVIALAADGSLWSWDLITSHYYDPMHHPWLAPSRRARSEGTIFAASGQ